uniref:non-specific serine/threonine protein kinase n=1 Tax=Hanusia phi TaxID=3032 RepID=A0A6T7PT39_9CRYP|mmetsp:Transcript_21524/g.48770  ORF Transcript_21524/g.48770 Transcript_21524/m.48770 type:complete len:1293 (+) Transcript_21524:113-3991(+)
MDQLTHEARARQLQADVLVHEQYVGTSVKSNGSGGSSEGLQGSIPSVEEMEAYTKLLNSPGEIQPHGYFMLIDEASNFTVRAVSNNIEKLFGIPYKDMIGTQMMSLFKERERLDSAVAMSDLSLANPVTVTALGLDPSGKKFGNITVNLILHRSSSGLLVDIEEFDLTENSFAAHQRVRVAIEKLNATTNLTAMCQQVVEEVFNTTGYNRVMVYKFHEDMHGEVIAECKSADVSESWLGLHFPATDLPQRTRDQLRDEHVRLIVDSQAVHAKLVTDNVIAKAESINLNGSTLRRAHRCHLEYLKNMEVRASLVLAMVVKDQLWGLIVCHHSDSRIVSYQMRMACEFLAQALAMRISSIIDMEHHHRHEHSLHLHAKLCDLMYQQGHNPGLRLKGLVTSSPNLTDLLDGVSGAAIQYAGKISVCGEAPPQEDLKNICSLIRSKCEKALEKEGIVVVNSMATLESSLQRFSPKSAGLLAIPVTSDGLIILFRPELSTTIRWGGDPNAPARINRDTMGGSTMHPRGSFEIYSDSIRYRCNPWLKWEIDNALGLGLLVNDIIKSVDTDEVRSNVLVRLNSERMQTQHDKEAVVSEMSYLIDSVKAPVLGMDNKMQIVQWNAMLAQLTNYRREEVLGKSLYGFVPESHRDSLSKAMERAMKGEEVEAFDLSIVKANAADYPANQRRVDLRVNVTARFSPSGNCSGLVCLGQDITATNAARGRQAELEQQMDAVLHMTAATESSQGKDPPESNFAFDPDKESALLGEGSFGKTYRMRGTMDGQIYAVKMVNVKKAEKNGVQLDALKREVHMLMRLNSPHIIRYYTCYMFKKAKYFCIVMEIAEGGTLGDLIEDTRGTVSRIGEERIRSLSSQLAKALAHIHSRRMLHRDIKPHNILLTQDGSEAKITDFGLACVISSAAAASSRAGTLTYASPEKAGAKGYDSKDDMWALGCIMSELITGVPISARCGGGVFAFNSSLVQKTVDESIAASPILGRVVEQLLAFDPARRPNATELTAILEPQVAGGAIQDEAEELCEEYICAICQGLVLDAHTVCADEHVFCGSCLMKWLENKNDCPTCRKPAAQPHRLRIINNAVEKLAARVLDTKALQERAKRREEIEANRIAEREHERSELDREAAQGTVGQDVCTAWKYMQGQAQFGAGCTVFRHAASGLIVEVFHGNGWYRFRSRAGGETRWCNSCGNLGDSDFGAQDAVAQLEGDGGEHVPPAGLGPLDDTGYWESSIQNGKIVLVNSDEEELYLDSNGTLVWLSHPGMNKAIIVREGTASSVQRSEGEALIS